MIGKIIRKMNAYFEREDELFNASRRFNVALTFARKLHGHEVYEMEAIEDICYEALKASESSDLEGLKGCIVRMEEFI